MPSASASAAPSFRRAGGAGGAWRGLGRQPDLLTTLLDFSDTGEIG